MTGGVSLLIPVSGLPHVLHHATDLERGYIQKVLARVGGKGQLISLGIVVDSETGGTVNFLHEPTEPMNTRAREALAHLTGVHMLFTGPVLFTGVEESKINQIVATQISTVET